MTHPSPTALEEMNAIAATDRDAAHVKTDGAVPSVVLAAVRACAASWVPDARLLGNVRAGDIVRAIAALEAELDKERKAADQWMGEAVRDHNDLMRAQGRIEDLLEEAQLATRLPTAPQNEIAELCRNLIQHNGLSADYAKHALDVINPQLVELARAHEDLVARHAKLTGKYQAALAVALDKSQTIPDHEHLTWDNCPHEHIGCQDCGAPVSGAATAEQSFDGTIHPDGTPNQVTASTWLSGAATPAPTAALTEEEHSQVEDARRTRQRELKYHAEKYPSEWWSEAILELTDIIDRIATKPAKSPPQGAEE